MPIKVSTWRDKDEMRIFDDIQRKDYVSPRGRVESYWSFLNRSPTVWADHVRQTLETWIEDYPRENRDELVSRLRNGDFWEAYCELVVHAILRAHGAKVSIHPHDVSNGPKHPDFLASFLDGSALIVEVVTKKGMSDEQIAVRTVWAGVYSRIDELESDYIIHVKRIPNGHPPASRHVIAFLERELAELASRTSSVDWSDPIWMPPTEEFSYDNAGTEQEIIFRFRQRASHMRGKPGSISAYPAESFGGGSAGKIREAVEGKAGAYGELEHPYVVFVKQRVHGTLTAGTMTRDTGTRSERFLVIGLGGLRVPSSGRTGSRG